MHEGRAWDLYEEYFPLPIHLIKLEDLMLTQNIEQLGQQILSRCKTLSDRIVVDWKGWLEQAIRGRNIRFLNTYNIQEHETKEMIECA